MHTHRILLTFFSIIMAVMLIVSPAVDTNSAVLTAQIVPSTTAASTLATQRALRVRFHRLLLNTARSHTGWERGLWLRGPLLAADYSHRAALVRFLRTELVPYVASERTDLYPIANRILGDSHELTSAAISDSRVIEGFVGRLDAAARSADARSFQNNAYALSIVVENYVAKDHRVIQQLLALGPQADTKGGTISNP